VSSLNDAPQNPTKPRLATGTTGAIGELLAAADLMRRGFHVFRALSPHCPSDLIAYSTVPGTPQVGAPLRVQVRTAQISKSGIGNISFPLKDRDAGTFDILALVVENTGVFYLPTLDDSEFPYLLAEDLVDRLRNWGILDGWKDSDASLQSVWPPLASGKRRAIEQR
jgi:hypothetical protein